MRMRWKPFILVPVMLCMAAVTPAWAQQDKLMSILEDLRSEKLERVIAALKLIETFDGDVSRLVPALTAIITADEYATMEMALRGLARMKSKASPAIRVLCQKLDDRSHWIRSNAVAALVAIGNESVVPVQGLLEAPSGVVRAAATEVLGRLERLSLNDAQQLVKDPDPRVRAAVTRGCVGLGKPGVPQLVALLADPEIAVSVQAARALRANRADLSFAVPGLIQALAHPQLRSFAGEALGSYGIEAQRAIPAIINSYALDPLANGFWFGDGAQVALGHIGPPHVQDIPLLIECLKHPHPAARIVAADSLALLGTKGEAAAAALSAAFIAALEHYSLRKQALKAKSSEPIQSDDSWEFPYLAQRCAIALWQVTHDGQRFLEMLETLCTSSEKDVAFYGDSPWAELTEETFPRIEKMLRNPDRHLRITALRGLAELGVKGAPLKHAVLELTGLKEDEVSKLAWRTLAGMGPAVADVAGPKLYSDMRNGKVALQDFAYGMMHFELRKPEVLNVLETGLTNKSEATITMCAEALCKLTDEPQRISRLVIQTAETYPLSRRSAILALRYLKSTDEVVIQYYIDNLKAYDTCREALAGLGHMGAAARPALKEVEIYLSDPNLLVRLDAARAILLISKNSEPIKEQLKEAFTGAQPVLDPPRADTRFGDDDSYDFGYRWVGMDTIADCQAAGTPFIHYLVDEFRRPPRNLATIAIKSLQAIGTPEAIQALEDVARSTDWELRSAANQALRKLRAQTAAKK